jgi:outer membrane lipoprotein carrier protein
MNNLLATIPAVALALAGCARPAAAPALHAAAPPPAAGSARVCPPDAAAPPPARSDGVTTEGVLKRMEEAGRGLVALRADFRQERTYALFGEKRVSSGTIRYKKPGMMRWEYREPDRTAIFLKEGRALMYMPEIAQVQRISLARDRKTESLLIGFGNTAEEITRNFEAEASAGPDGMPVLDLVPRSADLASHFRRLRLVIDPARWIPVRSERFEAGGDTTVFIFSNVTTDAPIDDAEFDFRIPPGTEVVEY